MAYQGGYDSGYGDSVPQIPAISVQAVTAAPTVSLSTATAVAWSSPAVSTPD